MRPRIHRISSNSPTDHTIRCATTSTGEIICSCLKYSGIKPQMLYAPMAWIRPDRDVAGEVRADMPLPLDAFVCMRE